VRPLIEVVLTELGWRKLKAIERAGKRASTSAISTNPRS